jgi:aryl-alcohol dehydrogenase-like predicted oxidoreductase
VRQRRIGCGGLLVGALGLCCQSGADPAEADRGSDEAIAQIHRALAAGRTLLDTADVYGPFTDELLLGRALAGRREQAVLATKCGLVRDAGAGLVRDGRPEQVRKACDGSLRRLATERIDLYQLHRVDPDVPIEETWGAMAQLVSAGKVRALGLCEVSVAQLRRAQHVFPVTSVRAELSLWARRALDGVLPWCRSHGVGFLAAAPLGRDRAGRCRAEVPDAESASGTVEAAGGPDEAITASLRTIAAARRLPPSVLALAWVLAQGDGVVPLLPGPAAADRYQTISPEALTLGTEDLLALGAAPWSRPRQASTA